MVTGKVPWCGESTVELQKRVLTEPLTFPSKPTLSRQLRRLLGRMLDKNPNTRATMQEIKVSVIKLNVATLGKVTAIWDPIQLVNPSGYTSNALMKMFLHCKVKYVRYCIKLKNNLINFTPSFFFG